MFFFTNVSIDKTRNYDYVVYSNLILKLLEKTFKNVF